MDPISSNQYWILGAAADLDNTGRAVWSHLHFVFSVVFFTFQNPINFNMMTTGI